MCPHFSIHFLCFLINFYLMVFGIFNIHNHFQILSFDLMKFIMVDLFFKILIVLKLYEDRILLLSTFFFLPNFLNPIFLDENSQMFMQVQIFFILQMYEEHMMMNRVFIPSILLFCCFIILKICSVHLNPDFFILHFKFQFTYIIL